MFYTYILRSLSHPDQRYIGSTSDLKSRLAKHNAGEVPHTSKFRPWKVESYFAFETKEKATAFEAYLKTGSGHAFANRHFYPPIFSQKSLFRLRLYSAVTSSFDTRCRDNLSFRRRSVSYGRTSKRGGFLEELILPSVAQFY